MPFARNLLGLVLFAVLFAGISHAAWSEQLTVTVISPNSIPVEGAKVVIEYQKDFSDNGYSSTITGITNSKGQFTAAIINLVPDSDNESAKFEYYVTASNYYWSSDRRLVPVKGGNQSLYLQTDTPLRFASVTFVDSEGKPLSYTHVKITAPISKELFTGSVNTSFSAWIPYDTNLAYDVVLPTVTRPYSEPAINPRSDGSFNSLISDYGVSLSSILSTFGKYSYRLGGWSYPVPINETASRMVDPYSEEVKLLGFPAQIYDIYDATNANFIFDSLRLPLESVANSTKAVFAKNSRDKYTIFIGTTSALEGRNEGQNTRFQSDLAGYYATLLEDENVTICVDSGQRVNGFVAKLLSASKARGKSAGKRAIPDSTSLENCSMLVTVDRGLNWNDYSGQEISLISSFSRLNPVILLSDLGDFRRHEYTQQVFVPNYNLTLKFLTPNRQPAYPASVVVSETGKAYITSTNGAVNIAGYKNLTFNLVVTYMDENYAFTYPLPSNSNAYSEVSVLPAKLKVAYSIRDIKENTYSFNNTTIPLQPPCKEITITASDPRSNQFTLELANRTILPYTFYRIPSPSLGLGGLMCSDYEAANVTFIVSDEFESNSTDMDMQFIQQPLIPFIPVGQQPYVPPGERRITLDDILLFMVIIVGAIIILFAVDMKSHAVTSALNLALKSLRDMMHK